MFKGFILCGEILVRTASPGPGSEGFAHVNLGGYRFRSSCILHPKSQLGSVGISSIAFTVLNSDESYFSCNASTVVFATT